MNCSQFRLVKVDVDPVMIGVSEIGWFVKVEIDPVLPVFLVVTLDVELALRLSRVTHSDISRDDNTDKSD